VLLTFDPRVFLDRGALLHTGIQVCARLEVKPAGKQLDVAPTRIAVKWIQTVIATGYGDYAEGNPDRILQEKPAFGSVLFFLDFLSSPHRYRRASPSGQPSSCLSFLSTLSLFLFPFSPSFFLLSCSHRNHKSERRKRPIKFLFVRELEVERSWCRDGERSERKRKPSEKGRRAICQGETYANRGAVEWADSSCSRFSLSLSLSIILRIVTDLAETLRFTGHGTFVFLPTANLLYFSVSLPRVSIRRILIHDIVDTTIQKNTDAFFVMHNDQSRDRICDIIQTGYR